MSDLIDRQMAIDALGERPMVWMDSDYEIAQRNQYDMDKLAIETVPSAQPEQRWIPVAKRLPKNREWVLGIFQEGDTGWINPIPFICDYVGNKTPITTQDNWLLKLVDEPHPYYKNLHCIAWMPLPEPYLGE